MSIIFLIGRIIAGGYFLFNAFNHFTNVEGMKGYADSKGVPAPKVAVIGSGVLLALGGAGVLLGTLPQVAILLLLLFLLPTTPVMHDFWNAEGEERMTEQINFTKNLAIIGLLLMLLAFAGPDVAWPLSLTL